MENYFSIGELSKYQNISKQTLIFYDKTGLFRPAYVDPNNGYRYYSASQLDQLDTILILKKCGLSLQSIKELLQDYTTGSSLKVLRRQVEVLDWELEELHLIRSRLFQRCAQLEKASLSKEEAGTPRVEEIPAQYLLTRPVEPPYTLREISIATKQCFAQSFQEGLPIFFQSGVIVPYQRILAKNYTAASFVFLPIEAADTTEDIHRLPAGKCATVYHRGDYLSIGSSYEKLLKFCKENNLEILSDSYEFCVNDYITTGDESEYLTKILFYVK
ncbi:transcriptional regulator MerR family [Clostridium sp. CAG:1013]|nr:transcriptional regulator MerR family [Clostridium sp. CAG:1013]